MSAAVPEALSPERLVRSCVVSMSNEDDRLRGLVRARRSRRFGARPIPRSARSSVQASSSVARPSAEIVSLYHRAAPSASTVPGTRAGYSVESWSASAAAASASKSGWRADRGSVPVVERENRSARRAGTTTRNPTRTRRPLIGSVDGATTQPPTAPPGPSSFHRRAIVGGPAASRPARTLRCPTPRPSSSSTTRTRSRRC